MLDEQLKNQLAAFAEYEREKIAFRTAKGRRSKAERGLVVGTGPADADPGVPAPAEVLDEAERSGLAHPQRGSRRHPCPPSTKRTRAPGRSSAGGSRSRSHIGASVVPISCQPPGDSRG